MYNLLISGAAGVAVMLISLFVLNLPVWGASLIGAVVLGVVFALFTRITMKKVMEILERAGKDLQSQPPRFEKAIRELKDAQKKFGKWQIYVEAQIGSQIGMIYYTKRDFSNAFPYLEKAFFKNWVATAMLAVSYMKRQKKEKMVSTFEKAVQWNGKESLLWSVYAYCINEGGEPKRARGILEKGLKKLPGDEKLKDNLECLIKGKKMNMRAYGDMWFQFHLESLGALQRHQMASMGGRMKRQMVVRK